MTLFIAVSVMTVASATAFEFKIPEPQKGYNMEKYDKFAKYVSRCMKKPSVTKLSKLKNKAKAAGIKSDMNVLCKALKSNAFKNCSLTKKGDYWVFKSNYDFGGNWGSGNWGKDDDCNPGGGNTVGAPLDGGLLVLLFGAGASYLGIRKKRNQA